MSAFRPQIRKTGNLPHLSSIPCKPEDVRTELKVVTDVAMMILLYLDNQKGKIEMMKEKYADSMKATTVCSKRMAENTGWEKKKG
eukprot:10180886-Ditylum_brightwellii.AAC.1